MLFLSQIFKPFSLFWVVHYYFCLTKFDVLSIKKRNRCRITIFPRRVQLPKIDSHNRAAFLDLEIEHTDHEKEKEKKEKRQFAFYATNCFVVASAKGFTFSSSAKGSRGLFQTDRGRGRKESNKRGRKQERDEEEERIKKRKEKKERDNAANSRCLLFPFHYFPLPSSSYRPWHDLIPETHLTAPSLFFRTPRGVANTGCLIRPRRPTINLNKWRRLGFRRVPPSNQQPDYSSPRTPRLLSPLSVARLLITAHPRTSVSIVIVEHSSRLLPRSSFLALLPFLTPHPPLCLPLWTERDCGDRGTKLSAGEKRRGTPSKLTSRNTTLVTKLSRGKKSGAMYLIFIRGILLIVTHDLDSECEWARN